MNNLPTLSLTTGKRRWNFRVLDASGKNLTVCSIRKDGKMGKIYTLNVFTHQLHGVRKSREGGERLYTWAVSSLNGKTKWDWCQAVKSILAR